MTGFFRIQTVKDAFFFHIHPGKSELPGSSRYHKAKHFSINVSFILSYQNFLKYSIPKCKKYGDFPFLAAVQFAITNAAIASNTSHCSPSGGSYSPLNNGVDKQRSPEYIIVKLIAGYSFNLQHKELISTQKIQETNLPTEIGS